MADLRESAVGPAQLACNGGNGVIRTPTGRRHAGGRLHMAQKPLCRSAWRAARGLLGGWLRRRWAAAGPVGKRPPDWRAARGVLEWKWLRCRWVVAGPVGKRPPDWRVARGVLGGVAAVSVGGGRAGIAPHGGLAAGAARRSGRGQTSRAHAELGGFRLRSVTARCSRTHAPGPATSTRRSGSDRPEQAGSPRTCAATPRENRRCVRE